MISSTTRFTSKFAQSPKVTELIIAPGNAGTAELGENVGVKAEDIDGLLELALSRSVDLTFVGPEQPLIDGIADRFEAAGLKVFGPTAAGPSAFMTKNPSGFVSPNLIASAELVNDFDSAVGMSYFDISS